MVFKYHVLSKSWLKYVFSKMRSGHPITFPNASTNSGCYVKIEILYRIVIGFLKGKK